MTFRPLKASAINYLVDAGPLIGLLDGDDQWHGWGRETLTVLDERLATTETAVAEACHRLRQLRPALAELIELIASERVLLVPVLSEQPRRVGELLAKYPLMATGDATLVVLSELCPRAKLITVDEDFRRYRRFRNQAIPLVIPERGWVNALWQESRPPIHPIPGRRSRSSRLRRLAARPESGSVATMSVDQLVAEIRSLPRDVVTDLVDRVLFETHGGQDPAHAQAWSATVQRRVDEIRSGAVEGIPGETTSAKIRRIVGR
ncbi:MAG: PIN domain-containing protein [Opitutaceae bacterium]